MQIDDNVGDYNDSVLNRVQKRISMNTLGVNTGFSSKLHL